MLCTMLRSRPVNRSLSILEADLCGAGARIGDCFAVPLPNGKVAHAQYVCLHHEIGTLVRVFDVVRDRPVDVDVLRRAGLLFPPVFVGLLAALRVCGWQRIGNFPAKGYWFPRFRATIDTRPGVYENWSIWDGRRTVFVGKLRKRHRSLELKTVHSPQRLAQRIVEGGWLGDRLL